MMELVALLNGVPIGLLTTDRNGHPGFRYEAGWQGNPSATPMSLSLPLAADSFDGDTISAVLWGLLPDSEHTLQRWATKFQVSARNPVALLAHVGEDCAGAIQFVKPQRLSNWLKGDEDGVDWLDDASIAGRLRRLRRDSGAAREPDDVGQFSLAGAQPKTALISDGISRWGVPSGRIPTSHILKPPSGEYDGYAENEHFCMLLAKSLDIPTASSAIIHFEDEVAICVERYDRVRINGGLIRIHQEDFCQALGIRPQIKYQNQGGPSPKQMAELLRMHSSRSRDDIETLFRALIFNWLICGTDAHSKNYSLLLGGRNEVRLAPLYDISSALPYVKLDKRKVKMAMKVGGHYRWWDIKLNDWKTLAKEIVLEEDFMMSEMKAMAVALPDIAEDNKLAMEKSGLIHNVINILVDEIALSSKRCLKLIN